MEQELAYSFHLGSDKNKSKVAKKTAKGNVSGTTMKDVKQVYLDEFEQARIEYNTKTRTDRQVIDYFQKVCDSQNDIACEIIIELGDMDFWKDNEYRYKMTDVYNEQIQELSKLLPAFKIANATIHYDETSPHMHVIGVPVIDKCKESV